MSRPVCLLLLALMLAACPRQGKGPDRDAAALPGPPPPPARWVTELPPRKVPAAAADIVWATIPRAGSKVVERFGRSRVLAVTGDTASLGGRQFRQYPGVPGALIHRAPGFTGVKPGDLVTTSIADRPRLAVVGAAEKDRVQLRYRWKGKTIEHWTRYAFRLVPGVAPLAWVRYPNTGSDGGSAHSLRGFVVAKDKQRAWLLGADGKVVIRKASDLRPLGLTSTYRAHQKVLVCLPTCQPGVVEKVIEPAFRYRVRIGAGEKAPRRDCLFSDLAREP